MKEANSDIRIPAVAGMFYPGDRVTLQRTVDQLLDSVASLAMHGEVLSLIVPHAGYAYSGRTAAYAYAAIRGRQYDTIIAVGPSHREYFDGISVYPGRAYRTPIGDVEIDAEVREALMKHGIVGMAKGHRDEHSLEVQLPFLQRSLSRFNFVPLIMGSQSRQNCERLSHALADVARNRKVLLLASSDLSHFHPQEEAVALDAKVQKLVECSDTDGLLQQLEDNTVEACGGGPMISVIDAGRILGASRTCVLHYTTSGEITGDRESVVGYLSAAILREN